MKKLVLITSVILLAALFVFPYETTKNLELTAEGIENFRMDCGSGFLDIKGVDGLDQIEVRAEIILKGRSESESEKFMQKYMDLSLEKHGSEAVLVSTFKNYRSLFSFRSHVINLTVSVPKKMDLEIDDGSGSVSAAGIIGKIVVDDGSGELTLENITGDIRIDDGSGDIEIRDASGDVWIEDGSGTITMTNIEQDVSIDDGSGSINIDGVDGDVTIRDDGSGRVNITNVKGKVLNYS